MIIVDDVVRAVDQIQKISDPATQKHATTVAIVTALAATTYYIMLGIVALVLGRRIINATSKAWKESQRDSP